MNEINRYYKFKNDFCDFCNFSLHTETEKIAGSGAKWVSEAWQEAFKKAKEQLTKKVLVLFPAHSDMRYDEDKLGQICLDCLKKIIKEMEEWNENKN